MATTVTDSDFDAVVLKASTPVLVDFWAPWCGPCRAVASLVDELADEYAGKVLIAKMNVDENPATPGKYGIRAIPCFILFKDGQVVDQLTGAGTKSGFQNFIGKAL